MKFRQGELIAPGLAMSGYKIKVRYRGNPPKPWKWEILGDRLITVSHETYATQQDAHEPGDEALASLMAKDNGGDPN